MGKPNLTVLSRHCLRRPKTSLLLAIVLTAVFAAGLTRLELRTDGAALYPVDEPAVEVTRRDSKTFRDPERVILLVSARPDGPLVASPAGFRALERLHGSLTRLKAVVPGGVKSLATLVEPLEGTTALVDIDRYLKVIPEEPAQLARLLARLHAHPLVNGLFLSRNGRHAALYVSLDPRLDREAALAEIRGWLEHQGRQPFDLRLTGPVVAEIELGHTVVRDLAWLTPLMALAVALLLFLSLRTLAVVAIAGAEVIVVMIWTLGAMGFAGVPITLVTTIMPVILLAMTVADEVHLLERVQTSLRESATVRREDIRREDVRRAMAESLAHLHRPIVLTSLTTAVGFFSFPTGTLQPLRQFGIFSGLGILLAMFMSFTLIPALAAVLPPSFFIPRSLGKRRAAPSPPAFETRLTGHETPAFWLCCALVAISVLGIRQLTVQDSWVDNFDPNAPLVSAERDYNANFWGSYLYDVVLRTEDPGFFRRPEGVAVTEKLAATLEGGPRVGRALSYLIPLRVIGDLVGIPGGPLSGMERRDLRTVNAVGLVLRKELDLNQLVTMDGRSVRIRLVVNSPTYVDSAALDDFVHRVVPRDLAGSGVQAHFSGDLPLSVSVVRAIVGNQLSSISWTLAGVALIILVAYRSPRVALLVTAPVVAAAALVFGGMGYAGVPLGIASSMFAALSVGAGVDFALHWWHVYDLERRAGGDHLPAVRTAHQVAGPAVRWNALVLSLSFLVLSVSALKPNRTLGWLLAVAILSAYAATLLLMPRLVRWRRQPEPLGQQSRTLPVPLHSSTFNTLEDRE